MVYFVLAISNTGCLSECSMFVFSENKTLLFRGRIPVANIEMENITDGTGTALYRQDKYLLAKYVYLFGHGSLCPTALGQMFVVRKQAHGMCSTQSLFIYLCKVGANSFASSRHAVVAVLLLIGSMCIKARERRLQISLFGAGTQHYLWAITVHLKNTVPIKECLMIFCWR